jgi:hypothetical protein
LLGPGLPNTLGADFRTPAEAKRTLAPPRVFVYDFVYDLAGKTDSGDRQFYPVMT